MKNLKIFSLTLLLLASPALAGPGQRWGGGPVPHGKVFQEILDKLDLTDEQKDKIKTLRKNHRESMKPMRDSAEKSREELDQAFDKNLPADALKAAFEKFSEARQALDRQRFAHMLEMRALLTDSQRSLFSQLRPKMQGPKTDMEMGGD
jgi:Spy/CpxP family protein refolding chaperone